MHTISQNEVLSPKPQCTCGCREKKKYHIWKKVTVLVDSVSTE